MRYCGSKRRFMKHLTPILTGDMKEDSRFIDAMGGGMNVICEIPTPNKVAIDCNVYIIDLWKELQRNGMENIPQSVSEETYHAVKQAYINGTGEYPNYLIGYVGACCSYGGAWFNGYARFNPKKNEDHIKEAYNGLKYQVENFKFLKETIFIHGSYDTFEVKENDIVYCDPPYIDTKKYASDFAHHEFYEWCRETSRKVHRLYVSEYQMPDDFKCIWKMKKKDGLGRREGKAQTIKTEKLFTYDVQGANT